MQKTITVYSRSGKRKRVLVRKSLKRGKAIAKTTMFGTKTVFLALKYSKAKKRWVQIGRSMKEPLIWYNSEK